MRGIAITLRDLRAALPPRKESSERSCWKAGIAAWTGKAFAVREEVAGMVRLLRLSPRM